jgi:hypothetical protein
MKILVFRLTEAGQTWYVWACPSPRLYAFGSNADARYFANQLAEATGVPPVHQVRSIEQAAALI